jgi:peptide/nickel transport system ATP-binding protein
MRIEAVDLTKDYDVARSPFGVARRGARLRAVDGVSFALESGRTLALVGESGSGKSTVARRLVGLEAPSAGRVLMDGSATTPGKRPQRGRVQMVFQDPYASLNPRWTVRDIVAEPLQELSLVRGRAEIDARVAALLAAVRLDAADAARYPHQFSGGQRQRIAIARSLATQPSFLVCDEPTSALDVSVQAQVLNLLKDVQRERALTCLLISHNLAVVRHMSDRVGVMHRGRIVELADRDALFGRPRHPYTRALLDAVPDVRRRRRAREVSAAVTADVAASAGGCAWRAQCPHANARCAAEVPSLSMLNGVSVACHAVHEGRI